MVRKLTITIDEDVNVGLCFLNELIRPLVSEGALLAVDRAIRIRLAL